MEQDGTTALWNAKGGTTTRVNKKTHYAFPMLSGVKAKICLPESMDARDLTKHIKTSLCQDHLVSIKLSQVPPN